MSLRALIPARRASGRILWLCVAVAFAITQTTRDSLAVNSVIVESKTFAPGQKACSVGVFITNDVPLQGIVIPLELRTTDGAAYITGPFPSSFRFGPVAGNRLDNSPLGSAGPHWPAAIQVTSRFAEPGLENWWNGCRGQSNPYDIRTSSLDSISPGAVMHAAVGTGDPRMDEERTLPSGSDGGSTAEASLIFVFNVDTATGCFTIDSCCCTPSNHLAMVNTDLPGDVIVPEFIRGVISIGQTTCADSVYNFQPVVIAKQSIVVELSDGCEADVNVEDVDLGSWDPEDGENVALHLAPSGPYSVGDHTVRLHACDSGDKCAYMSTRISVRYVGPESLQLEPDSLYLHFTGSPDSDTIEKTCQIAMEGCDPWLRLNEVSEDSTDRIDAYVTGRTLTIRIEPVMAEATRNGLYRGFVVVSNNRNGLRDTVRFVVHIDQPSVPIACDSVSGFVRSVDGEVIANAYVYVLACADPAWGVSCLQPPLGSVRTDSNGAFAVTAGGYSHLMIGVGAYGYHSGHVWTSYCKGQPYFVYLIPGFSNSHSGGGQPACMIQGVIQSAADSRPLTDATIELWDSYPNGSIIATQTADQYAHFGLWGQNGDLIIRANGYCPLILDDASCGFSAGVFTMDTLESTVSADWPYFAEYASSDEQFISGETFYRPQPGDVISATDPQGVTCGIAIVQQEGKYLIRVSGDIPASPEDEGAVEGDYITLWLNCRIPLLTDSTWHNIGKPFGASESGGARLLPVEYALLQNYPNPFNAGTVIQFDLKAAANWTVTIYNVIGQKVRDFTGQSATGRIQLHWDGRSDGGLPLASGVYFYRLRANGFTDFKKMMLVK